LAATLVEKTRAEEEEEEKEEPVSQESGNANSEAFSPKEWREFKINSKVPVAKNAHLFSIVFDEAVVSNIPLASCVLMSDEVDGEIVVRPYTPLTKSGENTIGFAIKSYPEGKLSKRIGELKPGDTIKIQGPFPTLPYEKNMKKRIGMIAGGSGITPMIQILENILSTEDDDTEVTLIYGNITDEDIMLWEALEVWSEKYENKFKVHFTFDNPPAGWTGLKGYVTADMIQEHLPPPSDENLILVCGPPPMVNSLAGPKGPNYTQGDLTGILADLGYTPEQVYKF